MHYPRKVNRNSKGEGVFKSPIFLNESMTLKWNFWGVGGSIKKPFMGGVWIFSGTTQSFGITSQGSRGDLHMKGVGKMFVGNFELNP